MLISHPIAHVNVLLHKRENRVPDTVKESHSSYSSIGQIRALEVKIRGSTV